MSGYWNTLWAALLGEIHTKKSWTPAEHNLLGAEIPWEEPHMIYVYDSYLHNSITIGCTCGTTQGCADAGRALYEAHIKNLHERLTVNVRKLP